MEWIYSQYYTIFAQYLNYFSSVLILLTSAGALSLIKPSSQNKLVIGLFALSTLLSIFGIMIILDVYNGIREDILKMSSQCDKLNGEIACDMIIQDQAVYLKYAIILAIFSLILLIIGHLIKTWSNHDKKSD